MTLPVQTEHVIKLIHLCMQVGEIVIDEELFAENTVTCSGQIIGLVVAESEAQALRAADAVVVKYTVGACGVCLHRMLQA